jgi:hypothetical protein
MVSVRSLETFCKNSSPLTINIRHKIHSLNLATLDPSGIFPSQRQGARDILLLWLRHGLIPSLIEVGTGDEVEDLKAKMSARTWAKESFVATLNSIDPEVFPLVQEEMDKALIKRSRHQEPRSKRDKMRVYHNINRLFDLNLTATDSKDEVKEGLFLATIDFALSIEF